MGRPAIRNEVGRFLAFCAGVAFLGALIVLLTGHGILIRETVTPSSQRLNCDYLTLSGIVTKDLTYGYSGFRPLECPFVVDPNKPTFRA